METSAAEEESDSRIPDIVSVVQMSTQTQHLIPFLCEAAPNPFNFFLCVQLLRDAARMRFVFLSYTYGLAHLHTELVLVRKFSLRIVSKYWQILFVLLNILYKIYKCLMRDSGADKIQKISLEKS